MCSLVTGQFHTLPWRRESPPVTIQHYYSIIGYVPGAVLFIPLTDLSYKGKFAAFLCNGICFTLNAKG